MLPYSFLSLMYVRNHIVSDKIIVAAWFCVAHCDSAKLAANPSYDHFIGTFFETCLH
jgi:hypothetical protein